MNQPKDYEFAFTPDVWPLSFDEVLGERELTLAFDYQPRDEVDMISEGIHMAVFAKREGDDEYEDISHLTDATEDKEFVKMCFEYLETTE